MPVAYVLTPEMRRKLKTPIGTLIRGTFSETTKQIKDILNREHPPALVTVGDTVTRNLVENQVLPKLSIVDNVVMREKTAPVRLLADAIVRVKNPAGTITDEAVSAVERALSGGERVGLIVEGEEDLLALPAVLYAPLNSLVVYGQPYEGVVVVRVTQEKKDEVAQTLKVMETVRKTK
jgi:uncharacterized protein (UPF0218 family)